MTIITMSKIQTWPYGSPNSGEDGAPKTSLIGGIRRPRHSSQSVKKALRDMFGQYIDITDTAMRTRPYETIAHRIIDSDDNPYNVADVYRAVQIALRHAFGGHKLMIFIPTTAVDQMVDIITGTSDGIDHMETLVTIAATNKIDTSKEARKHSGGALFDAADFDIDVDSETSSDASSNDKKPKKLKVAPELHDVFNRIGQQLRATIHDNGNLDIGMFGRMVADDKNLNVNAAASVAHSFGITADTATGPEIDFFTAVDDNPISEDAAASGMLGEHKRTSAIMFTQAWIDLDQLISNLTTPDRPKQEAVELAVHATGVFLRAFTLSWPKGNRTNSGDPSLPTLVMANITKDGPYVAGLDKAFTKPVSTVLSEEPTATANRKLFTALEYDRNAYCINTNTHVMTQHEDTVHDTYTLHSNINQLITAVTGDITP